MKDRKNERINILFDIVNNLYDKKYKIDNFRSVIEDISRFFNLKSAVFIKDDFGYYIDTDKYFYISDLDKLVRYKNFLKKALLRESLIILNNCNKNYNIFKFFGNKSGNLSFFLMKLPDKKYIIGAREVPFSSIEIEYLRKIKDILRKSIEQDKIENNLIEQAYTDQLTGLYNRRFFEKIIPIEIERAKRYKYPLSIIYMDIDNFKVLNDTYGHLAGDIFLQKFGLLIKEILRKADLPIRIGGDEIILFLPFTRKKDAANLAHKIRKLLLENKAELCGDRNCDDIDLSFGVIELEKNDNLESLVAKADNLMYQAKRKKAFLVEKLKNSNLSLE